MWQLIRFKDIFISFLSFCASYAVKHLLSQIQKLPAVRHADNAHSVLWSRIFRDIYYVYNIKIPNAPNYLLQVLRNNASIYSDYCRHVSKYFVTVCPTPRGSSINTLYCQAFIIVTVFSTYKHKFGKYKLFYEA